MQLDYTLFSAGYCTHPECVTIKGWRWRNQKYPALCALITHPEHGYMLFDTGYSHRFFDATRKWPMWLYQKITPVHIQDAQALIRQLQQKGIRPEEIKTIFLSHFHADHIAGIQDFPGAAIICSKKGYKSVEHTQGFGALRKGFASALLPEDFESRVVWIEHKQTIPLDNSMQPFIEGKDIFGDGSLIAIELPGHARGQYGLLFKNQNQQPVFLVADSCWSSAAYREYALPSTITYLVHDQKKAYQETLLKLHCLYKSNPHIRIIPSHCQEIWQELMEGNHA